MKNLLGMAGLATVHNAALRRVKNYFFGYSNLFMKIEKKNIANEIYESK